jgi:hypothetical protein
MKVKIKDLQNAFRHFSYDFSSYFGENVDTADVLVELISEDPGSGNMISCLRFTSEIDRKDLPESRSDAVVKRILEVYPSESEQKPVYSKVESVKLN